jgi:hypothetical protein
MWRRPVKSGVPEQRSPSREECAREAAAWWQKHRSAPNKTTAGLAYSHVNAWLGLLFDRMTPEEREAVELRPIDEPIPYG